MGSGERLAGSRSMREVAALYTDNKPITKETPDDWVWTFHRSPEQLRECRVQALTRFLADYERGKADGRYILGELPRLAFRDAQFELALCSHFLFLHSDHFSYEFHCAALFEMLRIAGEVRVFPLLTLTLKPSSYLAPLLRGPRKRWLCL